MQIAVISDTHGHLEFTRQAVLLMESFAVKHVIHCGDITTTAIPPLFAAWQTHYVFGNCDHQLDPLRAAIRAAGGTCHERVGVIELGGRKICFLHSDDRAAFHKACTSGAWDIVCYGHTHFAEHHRVGPTLVMNPGAIFRADPHSFAILDLETLEPHTIKLQV